MVLHEFSASFQRPPCERRTPIAFNACGHQYEFPLPIGGESISGICLFPWGKRLSAAALAATDLSPSGYFFLNGWSRSAEPAWRVRDFDRRVLEWMLARTSLTVVLSAEPGLEWPPLSLRMQQELQGRGRVLVAFVEPLLLDDWVEHIELRLPGATPLIVAPNGASKWFMQ